MLVLFRCDLRPVRGAPGPEPPSQALPRLAGAGLLPRLPIQPGADLLRLPSVAEQHCLVEVEAITVEVPAVPQVFEAEDRPPVPSVAAVRLHFAVLLEVFHQPELAHQAGRLLLDRP